MGQVNAEELINAVTSDRMETQVEVCPEGEFRAVVSKIDMRDFIYKKGDKAGQTGYALDVTFTIQDDLVRQRLGREPNVRYNCLLDISANGGLEAGKGKNISLGRLREALRQNAPGQAWSPSMMLGCTCMVVVKHDIDGDNVYANVTKLRAA